MPDDTHVIPHPSGLPGAPWHVDLGSPLDVMRRGDKTLACVLKGVEDHRLTGIEAAQVAAAIAALPDLLVAAGRLAAAYMAWDESAIDTAEERDALACLVDAETEAADAIAAIFRRIGLPLPDRAGETRTAASDDMAEFRPGGTA